MMKLIISIFLASIIYCCSGNDVEVDLNLYKFEKIVSNFINVMVPAYKKTTDGLFATLLKYSNKSNTAGNGYLFDMPNIINTIIPCYVVCKAGVEAEMWTIPQIINEPGIGPTIRANGEELAQLGGGLVGVSRADEGVIKGLTNLNNEFVILLKAPKFNSNGTIISVNSTLFANIIKYFSQAANQNIALGASMEGIGALVNSNMVKQRSASASKALIALFECLTNGGAAYNGIGKAMNKFVTSLITNCGQPDIEKGVVHINLPSLYKSLDLLIADIILKLNKDKNGFAGLPNDFSGPYPITQIPMQTPIQILANAIV